MVKAPALKGNPEFLGGNFVRYDEDVAAIKATVVEAVKLAVGSLDNIIKPGDNVFIKPNLAFQAPPESFAVVDPRVVEAVIDYVWPYLRRRRRICHGLGSLTGLWGAWRIFGRNERRMSRPWTGITYLSC